MLLFKNSFIKIRKSLGRFFSLIFIVALGSAFFAGVRETSFDMLKTADAYFDSHSLMDFRIVSTMGLTDDDVLSLQELEYVQKVVPEYSFETEVDGNATKVYGYLDEMNTVSVVSGRLLENENEILVEEGTYNVGDVITFDDSALDFVKNKTYTVVGTVETPMYIYENKGISTVGDGKLDTFMYIMSSNFTIDYYTEVYLTAKDSLEKIAYQDDYLETVDRLNNELVNLKPIRETARYEEILAEAMKQIYEAEDELNNQKAENDKKFADALKEIQDSEAKINQGWVDYNNGVSTLEKTKLEMEKTFAEKESEIEAGEKAINAALASYNITIEEIAFLKENLSTQINKLKETLALLPSESEEYQKLDGQIKTLEASLSGLEQVEDNYETLQKGKTELQNGKTEWEKQYNNSLASLNSAKQELINGEADLEAGKASYNANYATYQSEIAKAEQEILEAREEVKNIEKPVWYLFDREDNAGYTTFYDAATKIDSIAAVFPLFFVLVAFLMCMNTMTRMIEEERGEIGLFVSLGYSKGKIITSYLFYVFIATLLGLIVGLSIGYLVVPAIIYRIYVSMFTLPDLEITFNVLVSLIIALVCFGAMGVVTFITANRNFKHMPANLLRPAAPKMGKKVLLEKIAFIWKRLSFTWKVTVRNLFRYKKRIIMTLVGISGCTALLLTGFGIKDSIGSVITKQFGEIESYDAIMFLDEEVSEENTSVNEILNANLVNQYTYLNMESFKFNAEDKNLDIYVMAFLKPEDVSQFLHLQTLEDEALSLDDTGVILTSKTAEMLKVGVNDTFGIRNSDNELFILKVAGISRNYVNHYVYMSENYYEKVFGERKLNAVMANKEDISTIGNALMESDHFSNIQYTTDNVKMFQDVISSMDSIVLLIIGFSTFLAITVLYNLTTINISERTREIATLKVLGFHDREVSQYVYRETLVLTIFGVLVGLGLGVLLNYFVMTVAETDEILFVKQIDLLSYVFTFLIMTFFTVVVQGITYFILKRIHMIDSLKSVE